MSDGKVVIIMGSGGDLEFAGPAVRLLEEFDIDHEIRVASAHKTPKKLLEILSQHDERGTVYITVAGRSNALSGFVDANTISPVIACPPYSDKFGGADIFSSLRMPSGIGPLVVLDPESAALAAAKILALDNPELSEEISSYKEGLRGRIEKSDKDL